MLGQVLLLLALQLATGLEQHRDHHKVTEASTFIEDLERRTFNYFWETANEQNGLVPDRYPTPSFCSIAAVGFALTAYPIGVERGYVSRAAAAARTKKTLAFLAGLPQGPAATGVAGYHGYFYHFLDMKTGLRYQQVELSTIDTALFMGGVLTVEAYFTAETPEEREIRSLSRQLYERVDWGFFTGENGALSMGWHPESGFLAANWTGYNEGMILYILGLGSPTHPLQDGAWNAWTSTYEPNWKEVYGQTYLTFPPLFTHQYSHVWVDFRGIQDEYMRSKGIDYFVNSQRAVLAQHTYATENPNRFLGYGTNSWGITACDGPASGDFNVSGQVRHFYAYAGRGVENEWDDGTLAPTAAGGSIAFAPELVVPTLIELNRTYGDLVYSEYGFFDSFNPTFDGVKPSTGRMVPGKGWFDTDYIGIDQGPIVAMIENSRSGLIWQTLRSHPAIVMGLQRAGFTGGWLDEATSAASTIQI